MQDLPKAFVVASLAEKVYANGAYVRIEQIDDPVDLIRLSIKAAGKRARGYAMRPDEALTLARLLLEGLDQIVTGIEYQRRADE
jgi:hypothetical protein